SRLSAVIGTSPMLTPTLKVLSSHTKRNSRTASRVALAMRRAWSMGQDSRSAPNSSPPSRASVSEPRMRACMVAVSCFKSSSPALAAGVVHGLERVEVHEEERVLAPLLPRGVDQLGEPPLELAPVDEPGQRVVARLPHELLGHRSDLAHVVEYHDRPVRRTVA